MRSHPYAPPPPLPAILDQIAAAIPLPNQDAHLDNSGASVSSGASAKSTATISNPFRNPTPPATSSAGWRAGHARRPSSFDDLDLDFTGRGGIPLCDLDANRDTSRLLPVARPRRAHIEHAVRVQGRLALVRSVSVANLRPASTVFLPPLPSPPASPGRTAAVAAASSSTAGESSATTPVIPRPKTRLFESGVAGVVVADPAKGRRRSDGDGRDEYGDGAGAGGRKAASNATNRDYQFRGYGIGGAGNIRMCEFLVYLPTLITLLPSLLEAA